MAREPAGACIVRAAGDLGPRVIAGGVEDGRTLALLAESAAPSPRPSSKPGPAATSPPTPPALGLIVQVADGPTIRSLSSQSRRAAASSLPAAVALFGLLLAKYSPVVPATSGELAR